MDHREATFATRLRLWTAALAVVCCACQDEETSEPPEAAQSAGALSGSEVLRYASQPPSANGSFDFPYTASPTYAVGNVLVGSAPSSSEDLEAHFETLWDAQNLYVFVHISDGRTVRRGDNFPWENDSVEIYIDADHSAGASYDGVNDFQLVLTVTQPGAVVTGVSSAPYVGGITYYPIYPFRGNASDYQLRVTIPWSTLHVTPQAGREIGFDVHVNDNDDGSEHRTRKLGAFATVDDSWTNPRSFKTFVLGPVQPLPPHVENTAGNVVIDGVAQPGEWDHADEHPIDNLLLGSRAPGFAASYRVAWTNSALAMFVHVRDGQIVRDSAYAWEDDSVEIFLDPGPSRSYGAVARQYVFRPSDPTVYFGSRTPNPDNAGTISVATQLVAGGYDMEISVPWARFNMPGPLVSYSYIRPVVTPNALGMDVQVNDDRNGGNRDGKIAKFATVDDAWDNPARFGQVPLIWRPAM